MNFQFLGVQRLSVSHYVFGGFPDWHIMFPIIATNESEIPQRFWVMKNKSKNYPTGLVAQ